LQFLLEGIPVIILVVLVGFLLPDFLQMGHLTTPEDRVFAASQKP